MATDKFTSGRQDSRGVTEIKAYGPVPLACGACRSRKSGCDKARPRCGRCVKFGINCIYPRSRKSPLRKQTNMQELEERLAQVEDRVNKVSQPITQRCVSNDLGKRGAITDSVEPGNFENNPQSMISKKDRTLPLQSVIDALTEAFFRLPYSDMLIIHPTRYMRAFRGDANQKPPMYLQYAICALAAVGNKEHDYHHSFYQKARQSLEAEETKGHDEQHVSIQHAQAWLLVSMYEDKAMLFTRSIMSIARSRQVCRLMGLDLLDEEHNSIDHERSPLSWVELEECRRVFWCSFVLDAITNMSTGMPSLMDGNVAVRLPASDDAFISEVREETSFLHTVLEGAQPASFAGIVILCQVFKDILRHMVQASRAGAKGTVDNLFWARHHDLDERILRISTILMGSHSLPPDPRNVSGIRINLTLQASIICLHHAAIKECEQHDLSQTLAQTSINCLQSAAERAMHIIKSLSDSASILENTLCAFSLYVVTTALVFMARQRSVPAIRDLGITVSLMEKISPTHKLTRVFLHQVSSDINLSGTVACIPIPASGKSTVRTNQTTSSDSVNSHNTAPQDVQPSSMKQRDLAAWAVEEEAGSLACDCFSALLGAAKHNASASNRMVVLNRDQGQVSSIGHEHMMANDTIDTVSSHEPAMMGNQLIHTNRIPQDDPFLSTLMTEGMVLDDPLTWAGSWDICDNDSEWIFDSASYSG